MWELHAFREAKRWVFPWAAGKGAATAQRLFTCLYKLYEQTQKAPALFRDGKKEPGTLYIWFNETAYATYEFCGEFGCDLGILAARWGMDIFSTEPSAGETVWLEVRGGENISVVERTLSGKTSETMRGLCLRVGCSKAEEAERLKTMLDAVDWEKGVLALGWEDAAFAEREEIAASQQGTFFCYGTVFAQVDPADCLHALRFSQKTLLWEEALQNGTDHQEFRWLCQAASQGDLENRVEWELALHSALQELGFSIQASPRDFELRDGAGARRYLSMESSQYGERAVLKILFPLNL